MFIVVRFFNYNFFFELFLLPLGYLLDILSALQAARLQRCPCPLSTARLSCLVAVCRVAALGFLLGFRQHENVSSFPFVLFLAAIFAFRPERGCCRQCALQLPTPSTIILSSCTRQSMPVPNAWIYKEKGGSRQPNGLKSQVWMPTRLPLSS